jgi:hypothetical protein
LRCGYPVTMRPRRIMTNVLLMPALQFGNPVASFIHVKINDFLHRACNFGLHWFMVFLLDVGTRRG